MLRSSTRNVAQEVVSCLIDSAGRGVLTEIIKWLSTSSQQHVENQTSILDNAARKELEYTDSADEEEAADGGESFLGNQFELSPPMNITTLPTKALHARTKTDEENKGSSHPSQ